MSALQALAWAERQHQLGVHESPWGSNRVPYWNDVLPAYQGAEWCGAFVYDALMRAGADLSWTTVRRFVYTPTGLADARRVKIFHRHEPSPGEPVWLDRNHVPGPEHIAIVRNPAGWPRYVDTVGGNESDRVKHSRYYSSQIIGFATVPYPYPSEKDTRMHLMLYAKAAGPDGARDAALWMVDATSRRHISRTEFEALEEAGAQVHIVVVDGADKVWKLPQTVQ